MLVSLRHRVHNTGSLRRAHVAHAGPRARPSPIQALCRWEAFPELVGSEIEAHYRHAFREKVPVEFETLGAAEELALDPCLSFEGRPFRFPARRRRA